ncbi:MAG: endonuclease MutS2 [Bacteroidales bacterium]|nr:endonuclease MutS2 [Bacteroidales bacterium]
MIYPSNFEQKIEFDQIRKLLKNKCLSELGEEYVENISFSSDFEFIFNQIHQTHEFVSILIEKIDFPDQYFFDVRPSLKRIRIEGLYMDEQELFNFCRSLETIQAILIFFEKSVEEEDAAPSYPYLAELTQSVITFPQLIKAIHQILDKYGKIKDTASTELARIRRELANTTNGISHTLQRILRSAQAEGYVEKDVTPTMRDGRLVIPVLPGLKRKIKGIVHDESASGRTVYIEPSSVVEANNRIRELENEERKEIIRILVDFSSQIRPHVANLIKSYQFLAQIDFIRAKGLLAIETNSICPTLENNQLMDWKQAIHPLLAKSLAKHNREVVPLDITLNKEQRILLISGPNAGGKSVCLKTVGLLQYMLQCGLLIPVDESSTTGVFDSLFIDIGDEQSIEDDLSTYSSHLTNMKVMLRNTNTKSLILIDEFGGGTEPQIGGAIAQAILKRLNEKETFGVITTHYQNLKFFAEDNQGIINGAMLYDRHKMEALYQLQIGNPGSSFAVEIARKIGLPEDVIQEASELVGTEYVNADKYLQDIVRDKRYWERKRMNIRRQERQLEDSIHRYQNQLEDLTQREKEIINKAKEEAQHILSESNAKIENTIRIIKEQQAEKERTRKARAELEQHKKEIEAFTSEKRENDISRKMEQIKARQERKTKKSKERKQTQHSFTPRPKKTLEVGDTIRIKGQNTIGELIEIKEDNAIVLFGHIKMNVKLDRLESAETRPIDKKQTKATYISEQTQNHIYDKKLDFKQEIDVRGMRGDEALQAIIYFIDDAVLVGVNRVRILHGTGTGILKTLIREQLATSPIVKKYYDEHVQFGGAGITVVEL